MNNAGDTKLIQFLRHLKSVLSVVGLGLGLVMASSAAHAVASDKTYYWSANCEDCATAAGQSLYGVTGKLELLSYELGDPITLVNFRSFSYDGSNLVLPFIVGPDVTTNQLNGAFGADTFIEVAGQINLVPAANRFEVVFDDGLFFQTQAQVPEQVLAGGVWSTCAPGINSTTGEAGYYGGESCFTFLPVPADYGQGAVFSISPVPEPGVWAMLVAGLGVVTFMRRRRATASH